MKKGEQGRAGREYETLSFHLGRAYYDHIRLLDRLLEEAGLQDTLCPGMGQILFALFKHDDCIIKDLRTSLRLAPSHLTRMLVRMEEAGIVTRRRDPADGRAVRVALTPFGRSLEGRSRGVLKKLNDVMSAGLSDGQLADTKRALDDIVHSIHRYIDGGK